jgi:hypothetical protein
VKQALLAGLLVLFSTSSLEAGNIWPHSNSNPVATALSKLSSHTGINLPHVVVPKLPAAAHSSSSDWPHPSPREILSDLKDRIEQSGSHIPTHHWPTGSIPSPWTASWNWESGYPPLGCNDAKIEQKFEDKFDTLSSELDDLIATVPDYADTDDYQELVDDIEKLIDRHGDFIDRVDAKIEHISDAIDRTGDSIEHLDDVLDRLHNNTHIPAKALAQIEKQIERAKSRIEDRIESLEAKKSALEDKLEQYGVFQSEVEDYLDNVQNPLTPQTTSTLAAESIADSLAVSLNEAAAKASQTFAETTQQGAASTVSSEFRAMEPQTTSTSDASTQDSSSEQSQSAASSTFHTLNALPTPTLENATPANEGEVQFSAGANVSEAVGGGAAEVGGVNATFESQAGGTFSSDYFQTSSEQALVQSIGQTAFDKINFLLSDELQGWELHFEGDFDGSAEIVLGYDESILPVGLDESKLQIMHFNSAKGFWELPEGFAVDTVANQFRFSVDGFSPFLLTFNSEASPNPEPSTGVIFAMGLLMLACKRKRKSLTVVE